jgi:Arc/MetJ-type ribon-helix-helix transcriptional regulator
MPPITVIVSDTDNARIRNLVPGIYTSISGFVNQAIQEKLAKAERDNGIERVRL